jgi:hypothetical protein
LIGQLPRFYLTNFVLLFWSKATVFFWRDYFVIYAQKLWLQAFADLNFQELLFIQFLYQINIESSFNFGFILD